MRGKIGKLDIFKKTALVFSIVISSISLAGLFAWILQWDFFRLHPELIPISPNAAAAFSLIGVSLFLTIIGREKLKFRIASMVVAMTAALLAILSGFDTFLQYPLGFNDLFVRSGNLAPAEYPFHLMSHQTGVLVCILVAAIAFLYHRRKQISSILGFIPIISGWVVLMAYIFGVPESVRSSILQVSVLVAFFLILGGFSVILVSGPEVWPMSYFVGRSARARLLRVLVPVVFVFLFAEDVIDAYFLGDVSSRITLVSASTAIVVLAVTLFAVARVTTTTARSIDQAERALRASLAEKDVLLKEMHHRVKNNLQIVNSLVRLQRNHLTDPVAKEYLNETSNRIQTMGLIHETFYQTGDFSRITVTSHLQRIAKKLLDVYGIEPDRIEVFVRNSDLAFGIDLAIPLGLIVNELISNSLKYAFPDGRKGRVEIELAETENKVVMTISDNGIGVPENNPFPITTSFGLQIVKTLVLQIKGTIELQRDGGTTFIIKFPAVKAESPG